jgi:hypothetical protein
MTMTKKIPMPGNLSQVQSRFFGKFTVPDMVRLAAPIGLIYLMVSPSTLSIETGVLVGIAVAASLTWYLWTPYDQHLDTHLYHAVRWLIEKQTVEGSDLAEQNKDHVITENGVAVAVIEVSPTNLDLKTGAQKAALHSIYHDLFKTVTYPVTIHSRQEPFSLSEYAQNIGDSTVPTSLKDLKKGYLQWCGELLNQNEFATTHHYIVVRVDHDGLHKLQPYINHVKEQLLDIETDDDTEAAVLVNELNSRCNEVISTISTADLTADRLTGQRLYTKTNQFNNRRPNLSTTWSAQPDNNGNGEHRRSVYLTEFSTGMELGWPRTLLRADGFVDVTQVVTPRDTVKTVKTLQRLSEKLNAEIDSFLHHGYRGTQKLERLLEDVQGFLDILTDQEDLPVDYAAYITAHHKDRKQVQQTFNQICTRLQRMQVDYQQPVFRTDQACHTETVLNGDRLNEALLLPAGSAAAGFPFATQVTGQDNGVIYGIDNADGTPILLDRFSWKSHSMVRMGATGSGKSYAAKLELLRTYLAHPEIQIIVVDPKNEREYGHVIKRLGGKTRPLDPEADYQFDNRFMCFEVPERGNSVGAAALINTVQQIYDETTRSSQRTLVVIDEAHNLMETSEGTRLLSKFIREARSSNTAVTLLSQNASDFTHSREGRAILDNMPGKVFMQHERVPQDVVEYFNLSQRERQELYNLKTGTDSGYSESLVKVSGRVNATVRVEATSQEHAIIEAGTVKP